MSDREFPEILKMFDIYVVLLEDPAVSEQTNQETVVKAFQCAHLIEMAIAKAHDLGKESVLENHLHKHWLEEGKSNLYNCLELKSACDKLLEMYLKDPRIPTEVVDEYLKLYTQQYGSERLNNFLKHNLVNAMCGNIVLESLKELGVKMSDMQDEALLISWEASVESGNEYDIIENIYNMYQEGYLSKLIEFASNCDDNSKLRPLIIQFLSSRLVENDETVCLALVNIEKKLLLKLLQCDSEFFLNFADVVFYYARRMKKGEHGWLSDSAFGYKQLVKITKALLSGPCAISETIYERMQLVKAQANGVLWSSIEKDIGIG